ncbi:MAG: hypothetical protein IPG04_15300 [Polyangiaceae bacterium]|nr:hypothetical protein [Polyangiaceae bacterium]
MVDAAAWEFAEVDAMLTAGEALFGPYSWDRFDVLVMPPSFPYGGMENPRLTFVTPTLIAGDRSQARVIGHELAHAWTGNLVTNATAEHFWLNEGWTRYAELRIAEALDGPEIASMLGALCRRDLDEAIARFQKEGRGQLTRLRTHLEGIDPDLAFSVVPYDKGNLFLRAIEGVIGRERFDAFAKKYLESFRFGAVTTEEFLAFTEAELPGVLARVEAPLWIDGEGIPRTRPPSGPRGSTRSSERRDAMPPPTRPSRRPRTTCGSSACLGPCRRTSAPRWTSASASPRPGTWRSRWRGFGSRSRPGTTSSSTRPSASSPRSDA